MEGWHFHASKMMQPCWYRSQLWQDLHHQKSEDNRLSYRFFFPSTVCVWKHYWENWYFPFSLETTGVFNPMQGKKETNTRYFLWTLLLNTSPARNKRLERTEISTVQMTVLSPCLQFVLFSFTRYCGIGIQRVLHSFRPGKGRSKRASCRRGGTNSLATPFTHSKVLTQIYNKVSYIA